MSQTSPVVCPRNPLPRDLDLDISISRPQTEIATDMTMMCFLTPSANFPPNNGRVRYYSTFSSLEADTTPGSPMWWAGNAFFAEGKRPATFAVGRVFNDPIPAGLLAGNIDFDALQTVTDGAFALASSDAPVTETPAILTGGVVALAALQSIADGSFVIDVNGTEQEALNLDFTAATTVADVRDIIAGELSGVSITLTEDETGIVITTLATGENATLSYATQAAAGTNVINLLELSEAEAVSLVQGTASNDGVIEATGLTFAGITTANSLAAYLQTHIPELSITVGYGSLIIQTRSNGDGATLTYAQEATIGTDVSELLGLTEEAGAQLWQGYTPQGLASEAALVQTASRCNGKPIYGWAIDAEYRDTQEQKNFADWAEPQRPALFAAVTNSQTAYNTADTTNIGYYASNKGYIRTAVIYHPNAQVYPDVAYLRILLAVNYSLSNSTLTGKFKTLAGIEPVQLTETELAALTSRRINTYTAIGNNSRTFREGVQAAETWFTDSIVNLDNYREELQVEVYNVFLRNPKVPYSSKGQALLVSAADKICRKYVRNAAFGERDVEDSTNESGYTTEPAYTIIPTPMAFATTSERVSRLAPPIRIDVYETGAIHKQSIEVNVYN